MNKIHIFLLCFFLTHSNSYPKNPEKNKSAETKESAADQELINAVGTFFNRETKIKKALENGANPNTAKKHFYSLYKDAMANNDIKLVQLFLDHGHHPDKQLIVEECKSLEMAHLLIQHGFDISSKDQWGAPLFFECKYAAILEIFAKNGLNLLETDKNGNTLLHKTGSPEIATLLLKEGVPIDAKNNSGETPLHTVRSERVAQLLLDKGLSPDIQDKNGNTPLLKLIQSNSLLEKQWFIPPLIFESSIEKNTAIAAVFLAGGADVTIASAKKKRTPLHYAAAGHSGELVSNLLKHGASQSTPDSEGKLPLHYACMIKTTRKNFFQRGETETENTGPLRVLLENGGAQFINTKDNSGCTPLEYAKVMAKSALKVALLTKAQEEKQ